MIFGRSKKKVKPILGTTRMSTRGQIVIPEKIRKAVGWEKGDDLIVEYNQDFIVFRKPELTSFETTGILIDELKEVATKANERKKHPDGNAFFDWFHGLMGASESCLLRDILRAQKDNLWEEWKRIEPMEPLTKEELDARKEALQSNA